MGALLDGLWDHQKQAFNRSAEMDYYGLFFEQGTGKTRSAITWLRYKCWKENQALKTLIICPIIVIENWRDEIKANSKMGDNVCMLKGDGKERLTTFLKESRFPRKTIFITNYESLLMDDLYKAFIDYGFMCMIIDESQKTKNFKSQRTIALTGLADMVKYRTILTGTPILNTPMDIFAQYRILDRGARFGTNFYVFRNTYFEDLNAGMPSQKYFPNWVPIDSLWETFNEKIYSCATRVLKKDCLDLPPLVKQKSIVALGKDQAKAYDEMKKQLITYLNDKACIASIAMTKALRLQQIVSGFMTMEDGSIQRFKENPRLEALEEHLDSLRHTKTIVWAVFRENYVDIKSVCDKLKIKYAELHGGVSNKDAEIQKFKKSDDCPVLIGHPISGGIGVNFQEAPYSIWYSRNFSLEAELQAEARNYRGGSEIHEKITRIDLVVPGTMDEIIMEALSKKLNIAERILDFKAVPHLF